MKYEKIKKGIFLKRPNRFLAQVLIDGKEELCHVKNTGRCKELLVPKAEVYVECHNNEKRKTKFSLVAVKKGDVLINMDSQAPNKVVKEWLEEKNGLGQLKVIKPEKKYGNSRFDFYLETNEKKCFMEVKGVTLEENGIAKFPDAPTERGVKHILELIECAKEGYESYLIFVIQMKGILSFEPNDRTQPEFKEALKKAREAGVHIFAYDCLVTDDGLCLDQEVSVCL